MTSAIIQLEPLDCPSCLHKIEATVKALEGVQPEASRALFNSNKLKVTFDQSVIQLTEIESVIEQLGYQMVYQKVK